MDNTFHLNQSRQCLSLLTAGKDKASPSCPSEESNAGLDNWRTWDSTEVYTGKKKKQTPTFYDVATNQFVVYFPNSVLRKKKENSLIC